MTANEAKRLVEMHGGYRAAERATGIDRKKLSGIINGKQGGAMATAKTAEKQDEREIKVAAASGGFDLKGRTLMAKKPTDVYGPRFNALRMETGYLPEVLAKQWGCSINTVRDRAKGLGAIRYTEQDGQYIEVVVNPKTRGGK